MEHRMKAAASGAADPPSSWADCAGRRWQHRAPSPTGVQEGATKRHPRSTRRSRCPLPAGRSRHTLVIESPRSASVKEREPERAAVHTDGAEADLVRPNRADADEEDPPESFPPARRCTLRLPFLKGDSSQCLSSHRAPSSSSVKEKEKKSGEHSTRDRSGATVGCGAGLGLGLWRGGCLQTELIHFHLQKRLKRSGGKMQTKAENMGTEEAALGEPEPAAEATEAGSVTQQDQALQDEMERLLEENEDLKVYYVLVVICYHKVRVRLNILNTKILKMPHCQTVHIWLSWPFRVVVN